MWHKRSKLTGSGVQGYSKHNLVSSNIIHCLTLSLSSLLMNLKTTLCFLKMLCFQQIFLVDMQQLAASDKEKN